MGGAPGEQVRPGPQGGTVSSSASVTRLNVDYRDYQEDGETKTETTYTYSEFVFVSSETYLHILKYPF